MKCKDAITKALIFFAFFLTCAAVLFVVGFIAAKGIAVVDWEFLTAGPAGIPQGTEGGVFPAIMGSLFSMLLALSISAIFAVLTAIYTAFFSQKSWLKGAIRFITKNIAGLPSILFGLFGYGVFIVFFGIQRSLLSVSLSLATMAFPYIEIHTEKIFEEIDPRIAADSEGLGIAKEYTVFRLLFPMALPDILSAVLVAGAYVMGATAPVILTGAVLVAKTPKHLTDPIMTLPFHLHMLLTQGISTENAYGTAFVLILLLVLVNYLSYLLVGKWGKHRAGN